jgi:DNA-binding NtrC family response regulator
MDTLPYKSKLLIIHQNKTLQSLMVSMLETMGYEIETALSTDEGAKCLVRSRIELVVAEAELTDTDAVEAMFALKRKYPETPFILVASDDQPALARQAIRRGVACVLRFPTSTIQFRAAIAHEVPPPKASVPANERRFAPLASASTFGADDGSLRRSVKDLDPVAVLDAQNRAKRGIQSAAPAVNAAHAVAPLTFESAPRLSVSPKRIRWDDQRTTSSSQSIGPLKVALEEPERRIILEALEAFQWNRQETARVLEIDRTTLYKKIKKYKLEETLAR